MSLPLDCQQDGPCATPPGCLRHCAERVREVLAERDDARAEVERLTAENERLDRLFQETDGMRCHSSWVAQAQTLRAEVERLRGLLSQVLQDIG